MNEAIKPLNNSCYLQKKSFFAKEIYIQSKSRYELKIEQEIHCRINNQNSINFNELLNDESYVCLLQLGHSFCIDYVS